jgi:hypothetical protein
VTPHRFDKVSWANKLKDLSSMFLKHPDILYSGVVMQFIEGHNYMASSEGVVAKIPFQKTSLIVIAQRKNEHGEFVFEQIAHNTRTPDELPSLDQLKNEIEKMNSDVHKQLDLPKFDDEYNGPVLITGAAVAHVFSSALFNGTESVSANNFIPRLTGYQYPGNATGMDNKIGRVIISESMTVKAKPGLKNYNNVDLLGAFDIDDEGIVPQDGLVIIENGVLKNLLNDRTITSICQSANGFSSGPGVLEVTTTFDHSEDELKAKLLAAAKKDGLEHALIFRHSPLLMGVVNVSRISVKDGKEELLRNALLPDVNFRMLRRILGASGSYEAHNLNSSNFLNGGGNVPEMSFIVPKALLFESMDVRPFEIPVLKEEEYVSNPLLEIK